MNKAKVLFIFLSCVFLTGCATTKKVSDLELRVATLETKVGAPEGGDNLAVGPVLQGGAGSENEAIFKRTPLTNRQVQKALKNAGFYNGPVDGKLGRGSKNAIKEFQKSNGLKIDGVVGSCTSALLSRYLDK